MTIAALRALIEETTTMHTERPTAPRTGEQPLNVGKLLAWADQHPDPDVQDQSARARAAIEGLRARHAADTELAEIESETQQLEQRLAALRARETELRPPTRRKSKSQMAAERDHDPAVVRAWAKQAGVECGPIGRVPRTVVDQWKAAGSPQPLKAVS